MGVRLSFKDEACDIWQLRALVDHHEQYGARASGWVTWPWYRQTYCRLRANGRRWPIVFPEEQRL